MAIVTLTTDFGTVDGYVGAMKGVIASIAPDATVVDITHEIPPQDVAAAAYALATAAPHFPPGTVHVAVIDPGVGGPRRGVALDDGWQRFVGPDNGVFARVAPAPRAVHSIVNPAWRRADVAPTFHGRDVFAPAAARLAAGAEVGDAGPEVVLEGRLDAAAALIVPAGAGVTGQVVHVDRFGNLISNIVDPGVVAGVTVKVGRMALPLGRTYADVASGKLVAYVGSADTVEIAVRDGSAAKRLGLGRGAKVVLELPGKGGARRTVATKRRKRA